MAAGTRLAPFASPDLLFEYGGLGVQFLFTRRSDTFGVSDLGWCLGCHLLMALLTEDALLGYEG